MKLREKKILEHMIKNKGITELNAFVQYGVPPKQLKIVIRNLRNKGMSIAGDRTFMDMTYHLERFEA
jgi:hypothetical protein